MRGRGPDAFAVVRRWGRVITVSLETLPSRFGQPLFSRALAPRGSVRRAIAAASRSVLSLAVLSLACGRGDTTVVTPPAEPSPAARAAAAGGPSAAAVSSPVGVGAGGSDGARPAAGDGGGPPVDIVGAVVGGGGAPAAAATESLRLTQPGRLIAIGDLHGDLAATRAALRLGGAIDDSDRWIGGTLSVVQTGDQLDRGDQERAIVDLFTRLAPAARERGGRVVALNGNHEIMNVQGDFRYVTPGGLTGFEGIRPPSPLASGAPGPYAERAAAFLPGGAYALELAERNVVAIVGDSVFVHGGVLPSHVRYGLERINREAREWMRTGGRTAPEAVAGQTAPIWVRDYSLDPVAPSACETLGEVLSALGVRRMVVGHTVQTSGISSACDDRVYRIDVGLSRYYGSGPIQVLEIEGERVRILSAPRGS